MSRRIAAMLVLAVAASAARAQEDSLDTARIEEATGLKGTWFADEGVFKVVSPRTDVNISVDAWPMPPFMGLTSWAAFRKGRKDPAMVMGDLVLFEDEVNPVMSELLDSGLDVTALHNHFFFDEPRVYFMHIGGEGPAEELARGVRRALDKAKEIRHATPRPAKSLGAAIPSPSTISGGPIEEILGVKAQAKDGMLKAVFGRTARAACGCEVGKEMGLNTWAAFAGTDDNAVVDGDFAVLEEELQPVLRSLRRSGINVVAIHHHMTGEQPRMLFLHYWGRGRAQELARAVKAALEAPRR
jgi:hypothetical protein